MPVVFLGIGSNLGDRRKNIEDAIHLLETNGIHVTDRSSLIETNPEGGPPQGLFLNGALQVWTNLSPQDLLTRLKMIETALGRVATVRHGPRPIDIDILLYDNIVMNTPALTIPHPRMDQRDFVMRPLRELLGEETETGTAQPDGPAS